VIACGIDPQFKPVADEDVRQGVLARYGIDRPYLLYVGGINARKNIARLFEAYAQVRATHPDVILVVAGKRQWQTGEIDAAFRRFNLEDQVHFTGYVDDRDLPALYSAAELFVFPSLYEGFGLPPLEAMACGTPVVTSNASSLPEVVGDAALTVDPYDVDGLAAAIKHALTDEDLRVELRRRGVARAAQFTWQRAARETLAVYAQVLERATSVEIEGHRHSRSEHHPRG
jgi:glycosyltransferase involved in cell wall biosynthesis